MSFSSETPEVAKKHDGFQTNSEDPEERKAARRQRIERRVNMQKRQASHSSSIPKLPTNSINFEEENRQLEKQIFKSDKFLEKNWKNMEMDLNNAKVEINDREIDNRERDGLNRQYTMSRLEEEARKSQNEFEEIAAKWSLINKFNDPYHIQENIEIQKEKCLIVINSKDELIAELKLMLKKSERQFNKEQAKQVQDINDLTKKIRTQLECAKTAYKTQYNLILDILQGMKGDFVEATYKKWLELHEEMCAMEAKHSEDKFRALENFQNRMNDIRENFDELFRERKLQLSNVIDAAQQQFETIKCIACLNSEKLDYNYQILSRREDENIVLKGQQKRRINKLQDVITNLKEKVHDYRKTTRNKIKKYREAIKKLHNSILEIEAKADKFSEVNDKKFYQVWEINKKECFDLIKEIMNIDQVLNEQQIGAEWRPPEYSTMEYTSMPSYRKALLVLDVDTSAEKNLKPVESQQIPETFMYNKLLKQILTKVSDKGGFLTEKRLKILINHFEDEQKCLVTLENVFSSLNVKNEKYLDILLKYFLPYCYCVICSNSETLERSMGSQMSTLTYTHSIAIVENKNRLMYSTSDYENYNDLLKSTNGSSDAIDTAVMELIPEGNIKPSTSDSDISIGATLFANYEFDDLSYRKSALLKRKMFQPTSHKMTCEHHHPLYISTAYVLRALKEFVEAYNANLDIVPTIGERIVKERQTISRLLDDCDIETYWQKIVNIYDEHRSKVWDSLLEALKHYHEVLKERKAAALEVVALRKINEKLKKQLERYQNHSIILPPICGHKNYIR